MTFNACIKKHFDEAFGPYGFKKIKSKYPYWGRMVGDEILQIITYKNEWSMKPYKNFSIWGGVATVYRQRIDLDISPKDQDWLIDTKRIFAKKDEEYKKTRMVTECYDNSYLVEDEKRNGKKIQNGVEVCIKYLIPEYAHLDNIDKCYDFFAEYHPRLINILKYKSGDLFVDSNEGIMLFDLMTIDEYIEVSNSRFEKNNETWLTWYKNHYKENYYELYEKDYNSRKAFLEQSIDTFKFVLSHKKILERYREMKETRRMKNLEYIHNKLLV